MQTVWMSWLVRQGSSQVHTHKKTLLLTPLSSLSKLIHSTVTHLLLTSDTATQHPPIFNLLKIKAQDSLGEEDVARWWIGDKRSAPPESKTTSQPTDWVTQMPLKNFAIAFNQGINLQEKTPPCLPRGQSHRRSIVVMMRHACNEDIWTQEKLKLKFRCGPPAWFNLCGRRTFWTSACARSSSGRGRAQRTRQGPAAGHSRGVVGVVCIRTGRNAVARSTWNF